MKILIVNDTLICGGAEIYSLNLKKILEKKGHDVSFLSFDNNFEENFKKIVDNKNFYNIKPKSSINKLIFNPFLYLKIKKRLKKINPDLIIINNIFASPYTQLLAFKKYNSIAIIHDYSIVCPKGNCIKEDDSVCYGYKFANCKKECIYHNSKIKMSIKYNQIKMKQKIMKKYIDKYITPSENLNDYLKKYDYNATTINNPLDIDSFDKLNYKIKKTNNYIYVGGINHNKGIFKFIDAFNDFSKDKNVKLTIVGKPTTSEDEIKLHNLIDNNKKIEFLGFVKNDKVKELLKEYGFIIVPSLWIENYPTTVLEGMASKRVVIGSNRGGIPKMIDNNKGIMFDIMNKNDIVNKLNYSYNLSDNEYEKIVLNAYDYLKHNNSFETYSNKINEYIEKIKRSDLL